MNRLGLMVKDLSASELNWHMVQQANQFMKDGSLDVIWFYEELLPTFIAPAGAMMQTAEAWGYDGPVVATTLSTAKKLAGFPCPSSKLFYLWDLEWLRITNRPYRALQAVYGDPRLRLVCRTEEHKHIVEDLWCRPVAGVAANADLVALQEIASA